MVLDVSESRGRGGGEHEKSAPLHSEMQRGAGVIMPGWAADQ